MKPLKRLGLVAAAVVAVMMFAGVGTASAHSTTVCKVNETPCKAANQYPVGTVLHAELATGTRMVMKEGFATVECSKATFEGTLEQQTATTIGLSLTALSLSECNCEFKVLTKGTWDLTVIPGTMNGAFSTTGTQITFSCFGTDCVYGESTASIGTVTGGAGSFDLSANFKKVAGGFLCAEPSTWTASFKVTKPTPLWVAE